MIPYRQPLASTCHVGMVVFFCFAGQLPAAENWTQLKYDARRSGNAADRDVAVPLGLLAVAPLTDAVFTAPVIADGRVFVVDGAGVAHCFDAETLRPLWRFHSRGGPANCNNCSSPVWIDGYLHFGTMAGSYYVLDARKGTVVREIRCGEPVFSAPVVVGERVYFATLGARIFALRPAGETIWKWDYVKQRLGFDGDRWDGVAWLKHNKGRVTWRDQFCCSRDIAAFGAMLVIPTGGEVTWLEDLGDRAAYRGDARVPAYKGTEGPATFGLSIGEDGAVYRQWHRRDNSGRVEVIRRESGKLVTTYVPGMVCRNDLPGLLSFASVSLRGTDVFRCRPEDGLGCCLHRPGQTQPLVLNGAAAIAAPILLKNHVVYGGLDGTLHVVSMSGSDHAWSFKTAFGRAISAPVSIGDGRVYFGCEDGYLYALGPHGTAQPPTRDLELWKIRTPLVGPMAAAKYDWFTNFGNLRSSNTNDQDLRAPFRMKWIRRYEGTFKHLPVCGGGRMYTHTAEGQIFAVEQETGRLLWRRYFPGVYVSYTSPIYHDGKLLVPQAGIKRSRLRCFDAVTGQLLWESPFTGSPSWSRQMPPIIYKNLAIYMFGTGQYQPRGTGIFVFKPPRDTHPNARGAEPERVSWLYSHDNPRYPTDHHPQVRAWDLASGKVVWSRDFSALGSGGDDAGLCRTGDTLYYSCFFGYAAQRRGKPAPSGVTAALDAATGTVAWKTTKYSVTAGCTISCEPGRLYLGGYNAPHAKNGARHVWCLSSDDGSLIWESEPLVKAINVVSVGKDFVFTSAYGDNAYLIDKKTGKIRSTFNKGYACTRYSISDPYVIGPNLDLITLRGEHELVSTGPPIDVRDCVGGIVSNGRLFYTTQAAGLQMSKTYGKQTGNQLPVFGNSELRPRRQVQRGPRRGVFSSVRDRQPFPLRPVGDRSVTTFKENHDEDSIRYHLHVRAIGCLPGCGRGCRAV